MQNELKVTFSRSWLLAGGSVVAVVALVVGLWIGINLGSPGQTSIAAASFDSGSLASSQTSTDGFGKVTGKACSSFDYE